jgi:hypothetical protein
MGFKSLAAEPCGLLLGDHEVQVVLVEEPDRRGDSFTDVTQEAVVDQGTTKNRTASRYETILTKGLTECRRFLKPGGRISMVFGNSAGSMSSLVQHSIQNGSLAVEPDKLIVLNKGSAFG